MAESAPSVESPPIISYPQSQKMDRFRYGDTGKEGGKDVGVAVHLKAGEQNFSFALMIDPNDPKGERIVNLPDSRPDKNNLNDKQWQRVGVLQQENNGLGDLLVVTIGGIQRRVSKADLAGKPSKVWLSGTTGFEVLDFDPNTHVVTIHQIKRSAPPVVPLVERKPGWRRKLIDFIPPLIIGSGGPAILPGDSVPPPPQPIIQETPEGMPSEQILTPVVEGKTPEAATPELDDSLRCPATKEFTIKAGGSLTRALVEINGLGRYLTDEAKLNKDLLYRDLLCLIAQPENMQLLEERDSKVADLLKELTSEESRRLLGPLTADGLSEALAKLNSSDPSRRGFNEQLVFVQPEDTVQVPQFSHPGE